ncbi:hypothetical protein GCM10010193_12380 [Kitasatospora atroaurantiaca]|uniref:DUF7144 domain-containing protein n=1 Tax=Kitasatospora atroaurantiaca TaxID=285545 RepID=A0A561EQQ8_9ACTN|nr:hypothetical protein [Kitasatospora atroaurantiaca]TWE17924.1 hypothetical protein FB465_2971 [Kitasatospora atroaurantiaca]
MSQASGRSYNSSGPVPDPGGPGRNTGFVTGLVLFAGVMMVVNGLLAIFQGIVAVAKDEVFVRTHNYTFKFDLTSWGWIHIALGAVVAAVGVAVLMGQGWGRVAGIAVVSISLVFNFLFVPYHPIWTLVVIAIDAFILWALCVYREEPA